VTGIVLGSGLSALADGVEVLREVSFAEAGLPESSVPGHAGSFVIGRMGAADVILMRGRLHLYEGHSARTVTAGIRWMAEQGVRRVVLTNAAGTLNRSFQPGAWMMLTDHINLTGAGPLEGEARFVDLTRAYDPAWSGSFRDAARASGMILHEGVYAGLRGPQYETPAEIGMLRVMGADAVGMSTVLETIQARALGLAVAGFSCLTNWAAGIGGGELDHAEVQAAGQAAAGAMLVLLREVVGNAQSSVLR
jgi:purine-nucleoside phosphorylase